MRRTATICAMPLWLRSPVLTPLLLFLCFAGIVGSYKDLTLFYDILNNRVTVKRLGVLVSGAARTT